jgi:hypothetical protein
MRCSKPPPADVAKLADAPDLGSGSRKGVEVQVLSSAPDFCRLDPAQNILREFPRNSHSLSEFRFIMNRSLFAWTARQATFVYPPMGRMPRTAVLRRDLRVSRPARAFDPDASDLARRVGEFRPDALAGSYDRLVRIGEERCAPLRNAVIVFTAASDRYLRPEEQERLWNLFGVPVFEQVLSPAGELLAYECEAHGGLHVVSASLDCISAAAPGGRCPCGVETGMLSRAAIHHAVPGYARAQTAG